MSAEQKIVHGRGPSNINLASLFAALMFAGLHNQSPLLTMALENGGFFFTTGPRRRGKSSFSRKRLR